MPSRYAWRLGAGIAAAILALVAPGKGEAAPTLRQGSLQLAPCADRQGWCGALPLPLDPSGRVAGDVRIGFRWFPPADAAAGPLRVITAVDGGPGYGATRSAADYRALIGDLAHTHALLLVDNRGTGASGALACDLIDGKPGLDRASLAQCGARLGEAVGLYGSAYAADDLAALLDALGVARISLYAVSYGTYFAQHFAARHPDRLDRMVLDSAYPAWNASAFFPASASALDKALRSLCERHAATCTAEPDLLGRLLARLRERSASGKAPDVLGGIRRVTLDPGSLYVALMHASGGLAAFRDFHAAARAYLDHADPLPLLRLVAEGETLHDPSLSSADPADFSKTLFGAVSCSDNAKLFDMTLPPAERRRALGEALARLGPAAEVHSPFTLAEVGRSAFQENRLDLCLDWPSPPDSQPRRQAVPAYAPIPVLVITGEFDVLTTVTEGAAVSRLFPRGLHHVAANRVHAPALLHPDDCAASLARAFLAGDAPLPACPPRMTVHPLPPRFARTADAARLADIGIWTALDAATRHVFGADRLAGLRGGTIRYRPSEDGAVSIRLHRVRWTEDAETSGKLNFTPATGALSGRLTVHHRGKRLNVPIAVTGYPQ